MKWNLWDDLTDLLAGLFMLSCLFDEFGLFDELEFAG